MWIPPILLLFGAILLVGAVLAFRRHYDSGTSNPLELFVCSAGSDAVTVFGLRPGGGVAEAPLRVIHSPVDQPSVTGLDHPWDVAVEASGSAYVISLNGEDAAGTISAFPPGADGSVAPAGTYPSLGLSDPTALALRGGPPVLLATFLDLFEQGVAELPLAPNFAAPTGRISGGDSPLMTPAGVAVGSANEIIVTDAEPNRVHIYEAYHPGTHFSGPPTRVIQGPNTLLDQPQRVAQGADGRIFVTNRGNASITVYAGDADGDAAPVRRIGGPGAPAAGLDTPMGIAVDYSGQVFVADGNRLLVFAPNAHGDVAPIQVVTGDETNRLNLATGVALHVPKQ